MTVHWPIIRSCLGHAFRPAIVDDSRTYRFVDILLGALHIADRLEGACQSQTVGVLLPTGGAFPMAALGAWMLGKTVVPLNYLLKPDELRYVVADCGADTVISAGPMLEHMGLGGEREAASALCPGGRVRTVLRMESLDRRSPPTLRWPARPLAMNGNGAGAHSGDDLSDVAVLLYTSGTSGKPKGVMLTHGNIRNNILQTIRHAGFTRMEKFLGVLPQFHSFGMTVLTLLPLMMGCPVISTARFVPQRIVKMIREHRPTVVIAIPSMYNALLHVKDASADDWTSLRYVISGGEPLPGAVAQGFFERFGVRINEGYGLTETSPATNVCLPHEYREHSVGRAFPDIDQRIVSIESGRDVAAGVDGEIRMKGPNIMRGYYRLPTETAAAFDERGYFRTGDIGRVDADGHLYITGRLKEMLIVGGENVFPREIEEVLNRHPTVKDSGVVGVVDDVRGELPLAFVELKDGEGILFDQKALLAHCRASLAGYKVPREIRCVAALPRNPTGKVMRRELKKLI